MTLETVQVSNSQLEARYASKLEVNNQLNRQLVSYQANKNRPLYRWFKYKEGFSEPLVQHLLDVFNIEQGKILDPFAGTGTTLFAASSRGVLGVGVELLPIGYEVMYVRHLATGVMRGTLRDAILRWLRDRPWQQETQSKSFPHLTITAGAFPPVTQQKLEHYLAALERESEEIARLLRFAAICVLEDISYTRKDGQYLRWDYRSGRRQGAKPFDKGTIEDFETAIIQKLNEIAVDLADQPIVLDLFSEQNAEKGAIQIIQGSSLELIPTMQSAIFDAIITSPPYCNRYDYTRTYALELALLGVTEQKIRHLRQAMLSCTVENREKSELITIFEHPQFERVNYAFAQQQELQSILKYLNMLRDERKINNPGIPRMVRNYFFEMALIIFESYRLLIPGSPLIMVNDNVRYGGAIIPVDLILSDFAEMAGFMVEKIWVLPSGKGNSSQQMGMHGREEVRKCVYVWRR